MIEKLLLHTCCPYCKTSLNRDRWIELSMRHEDGRKGKIFLNAYFGDYSIKPPFPIAEGTIAVFSCPHCQADLTMQGECVLCGAPMFLLELESGGVIDACCRRGCPGHALGGIEDIKELKLLIDYLKESNGD